MPKKIGICINVGGRCPKALKKERQEADVTNFKCTHCGCELKESKGPEGPDWKKIGISAACVLLVGGLGTGSYFLLSSSSGTNINSIHFDNPSEILWVGDVDTLRIITDPADTPSSYIWSTDNDAVATVDNNGIVSAIGTGQATITAKLKEDESISTSHIYAVDEWAGADVEKLWFMEKELNLNPGSTKSLSIDCTPGNANEQIFYNSEDTQVATVSDKGLVTAVTPGITTITATTSRTHKSASIQVKVKDQTTKLSHSLDLGFATYEGDMKNGKPEGNGTMTFKKRTVVPGSKGDVEALPGEYAIGKWVNGEVNLVTLYKKDGNKPILTHK